MNLFKDALDQLTLESIELISYNTPLVCFTSEIFIPSRIVTLPISLDKSTYKFIYMVNFLVVDNPRAYNIILGRLFIITTRAIVSMHYLAMKISASKFIITIKEDQ